MTASRILRACMLLAVLAHTSCSTLKHDFEGEAERKSVGNGLSVESALGAELIYGSTTFSPHVTLSLEELSNRQFAKAAENAHIGIAITGKVKSSELFAITLGGKPGEVFTLKKDLVLALPAAALPAAAIPSNAIPANAIPASAIPSNALPDQLVEGIKYLATSNAMFALVFAVDAHDNPYGTPFRALIQGSSRNEKISVIIKPAMLDKTELKGGSVLYVRIYFVPKGAEVLVNAVPLDKLPGTIAPIKRIDIQSILGIAGKPSILPDGFLLTVSSYDAATDRIRVAATSDPDEHLAISVEVDPASGVLRVRFDQPPPPGAYAVYVSGKSGTSVEHFQVEALDGGASGSQTAVPGGNNGNAGQGSSTSSGAVARPVQFTPPSSVHPGDTSDDDTSSTDNSSDASDDDALVPRTGPAQANLFGIGEPITRAWYNTTVKTTLFDAEQDIGAMRMREWIDFNFFFNSEGQIHQDALNAVKDSIALATARGIEIFGVEDGAYPTWMTGQTASSNGNFPLPPYSTEASSDYQLFLEKYEQAWFDMASALPEITHWEIENEPNFEIFFYKKTGTFTLSDMVKIYADMLYRATRAVNKASSANVAILGGLAWGDGPIAPTTYLRRLYEEIESREDPSTDKYFEALAWHPYIASAPSINSWVKPNIALHDIAVEHGDGAKPVYLTEMGFSEGLRALGYSNFTASNIEQYLKDTYTLAHEYLPFVETIFWFRLANTTAEDLDDYEFSFGLLQSSANASPYARKGNADAYEAIKTELLSRE